MRKTITLTVAAAIALTAGPAFAQAPTQQTPQQDPFGVIFGALFGDRLGNTSSIEAQWAAGQTPLANQRSQFESRVDNQVRAGAVNQQTASRLKSDYDSLVQLESRYGADRRFTSRERSDLADRYGALTQVLAVGTYDDGQTAQTAEIADGRAEFERRVDSAVYDRRVTRTQGRRLKTDYAALIQVESGYLQDGVVSSSERSDLDARLDALDARLGDTNYGGGATLTPRSRLDAIGRALPSSGLSTAAQAQLQVEYQDLSHLEAAYAQLNASSQDRAYLDQRLTDLETRIRMRR
ncbi:hypothetical protein KK137_16220 [Croceibacterium sp. LX-88]|uniref:Uncharacterized protein n=1 Tax=Croceibacterium selenioxidans TaxID=2838833 RepID=A0ABS5W993_9SPHN|nr:hypothetical protein [Croceibacterium selenioxidans]MBT2135883.1 hypothetical protein [Croceibacterium selenioxidans]